MKATINLGKELVFYANRITNVFTTKDYVKDLQDQYVYHVHNFYRPDSEFNDFTNIYRFKKIISDTSFEPEPCNSPLSDIENAADELRHILDNRSAYESIFSILMDDCKGTNDAGMLVYDLLSVLRKSSKDFHETALKYDRYMGNDFSVADVIHAVFSYGKITGLVDYYNLEEDKDA